MSRFAYYPGCSLHSTAAEYDLSARHVASKLGIELIEIPDWSCCGASAAHATDRELDLALNARNLSLASHMGCDIVAPCASCFNRLSSARQALLQSTKLQERISLAVGEALELSSQVITLLELFTTEDNLDKLHLTAQKSLSGLKVVAYYGCLLTPTVGTKKFDNMENPVSMDKLVSTMGGEALPWPYKTECCGGDLSFTGPDAATVLIERLLSMAVQCGAECIVTACPLCQSNLDLGQRKLAQKNGKKYGMPILYFTQLMGLVLGLNEHNLGLDKHLVGPRPILQKVGLV